MCKVLIQDVDSKHFEEDATEVLEKEELQKITIFSDFQLSQFLDPNGEWVLAKNGSYKNFFDDLPETMRVGPWNIGCCMYISALVYWILWNCVECYINPPTASEYTYHDVNTWQWRYNAVVCAWTFYVSYHVSRSPLGWYSWMSYTQQSWTLIMARHLLSTLVPFFPSLAPWNEYIRFPMLLQTTVVFVVWNFALMPAVWTQIKTAKDRKAFTKFCFGFLLINLHFLNLPFAAISGVYGSPARELNKVDLCVALGLALQYVCFYLFFLDRVGCHPYFIFSPRSPLALFTWSSFLGCVYAGFALWQRAILEFGTAAWS